MAGGALVSALPSSGWVRPVILHHVHFFDSPAAEILPTTSGRRLVCFPHWGNSDLPVVTGLGPAEVSRERLHAQVR